MLDHSLYSFDPKASGSLKISDNRLEPVKCESVEYWHFGSGEPKECVKSHAPEEVEAWIRESRPENATGGLRLLIATELKYGTNRLPFNREALSAIISVFHVPLEYLDKALGKVTGMFRYRKDAKIVSWIIRDYSGTVVISYFLEQNLVVGVVVDTASVNAALQHNLRRTQGHTCHPMLVPTLLAAEHIQKSHDTTHGNKSDTIITMVGLLERKVGLRHDCRENETFLRETSRALREGTEVRASIANAYQFIKVRKITILENVLKAIRYVDEMAIRMDAWHPSSPWPATSARQRELHRCGQDFEEHVENLMVSADRIMLSLDNLRERAGLQISALSTLFAQRDNRANLHIAKVNNKMARDSTRLATASKRDSSSMKIIAVLTAVFLPGTFVSAIFSTPMVESSPSTFWIYWAITIPLTGLIMGIWGACTYWVYEKIKSEDEEAWADTVGTGVA